MQLVKINPVTPHKRTFGISLASLWAAFMRELASRSIVL
jgi:hypothetical protein